jgi:hypothetical protein
VSASQVDQIREALLRGEELTPIEALRRFGCLRLAARVSDLRRDGLQIESETVEANGKRFARYRLESPQRSLL